MSKLRVNKPATAHWHIACVVGLEDTGMASLTQQLDFLTAQSYHVGGPPLGGPPLGGPPLGGPPLGGPLWVTSRSESNQDKRPTGY